MRIAMFEGYGDLGAYRRRRRRRRSGGGRRRTRQQTKLARAAKACKGRRKGAFYACVRKKLRSGR